MKSAQILSTGSYLPGEPISNEELAKFVGELPPDILEGIQVKRRHWIADLETGAHKINNSEMAVEASRSTHWQVQASVRRTSI